MLDWVHGESLTNLVGVRVGVLRTQVAKFNRHRDCVAFDTAALPWQLYFAHVFDERNSPLELFSSLIIFFKLRSKFSDHLETRGEAAALVSSKHFQLGLAARCTCGV